MTVAAFYRFFPVTNAPQLRDELRNHFVSTDLLGTILVAPEGINGTMAASAETIEALLDFLQARTGLTRDEVKFSTAEVAPFKRLKFKLKREIITFRGVPIDATQTGHYVAPAEWNALIADPAVLLLDTRNTYESALGTFANATTPALDTFSEFATYVDQNLDPARHTKVAMFCTGGIRCEKASAYMLQRGFPAVYHLQGGILKYLEEVPAAQSRWRGNCYIFDDRVSLDHADYKTTK